MVICVMGLSAAGKTTISGALYKLWKPNNPALIWLDSEDIRANLFPHVGYSYEERDSLGGLYTNLFYLLDKNGLDVIISTIGGGDEWRAQNKAKLSDYKEVLLSVPMEILKKRDKKGLYSGNVPNVVGIDIKPEYPDNPDILIINDGSRTPEEVAGEILEKLTKTRRHNKND